MIYALEVIETMRKLNPKITDEEIDQKITKSYFEILVPPPLAEVQVDWQRTHRLLAVQYILPNQRCYTPIRIRDFVTEPRQEPYEVVLTERICVWAAGNGDLYRDLQILSSVR